LLTSLDINPDEIENKRYATAFRILYSLIEKQNEEIEFLKSENQRKSSSPLNLDLQVYRTMILKQPLYWLF